MFTKILALVLSTVDAARYANCYVCMYVWNDGFTYSQYWWQQAAILVYHIEPNKN